MHKLNHAKKIEFICEPPKAIPHDAWCFIFYNDLIFLVPEEEQFRFATPKDNIELINTLPDIYFLGEYLNKYCYVGEIPKEAWKRYEQNLFPLRLMFEKLGQTKFEIACKTKQLLRWYKQSKFCGACGQQLFHSDKERAKICASCELTIYPEMSPAIIVLVKDHDRILLARSPHFNPGMYSILAGFVEPGESLEEAVIREVHEEVGIQVKNIRYVGSQSWPFPNSLMLGFVADYASGEIVIDGVEIEDAAWFTREELPLLPNTSSIARTMIEAFLKNHEFANS